MAEINDGNQYSTWVGLIYIFNLIVGTGALTLPAVFSRAGWMLGLIVILVLAFISFVTVTFVIEVMASANAIVIWRRIQQRKRALESLGDSEPFNSDSEDTPLVHAAVASSVGSETRHRYYVINEKIEMGEMASIFFSRFGTMLFYTCLVVYLYGDLSIYGAAVAKSLADVACTLPQNLTSNDTIPDAEACWENSSINRLDAYRLFLTLFVISLGPFVFFNVQKTKYLQYVTSGMRWLAFSIMIVYALRRIIVDGPQGNPSPVNLSGVPGLFGACVYSFMCHHSLPALVAPISNKTTLNKSLAVDYFIIAFFYLILAFTGAFAFEKLDNLYTLDFGPGGPEAFTSFFMVIIEYFLALFPVFTLSTSFPIIAITLRNNLQTLFLKEDGTYNFCLRKLIFPILAVVPPYLIAMSTKDLSILVEVTGSYAGAGIQYLIPTFLVYHARQKTQEVIGQGVINKFASPFKGIYWLVFVIVWAIACMILVSVHLMEVHLADRSVRE
ncbi:transmembrane protein 104 homolog isoform X1 [Belonocnema kinseyi]|uniref:transmembrane protein 104 homolog isoform X1 n=1 Tax=Belonocnema kinseyi TaxID=2817044 RepID=UPI00143DAE56|nr:transmembrane protein 104 homolog isoform X1 [Belonocnema kinseyi]